MIATLMGALLFKVNEAKQVAESEKIRVLQKVLEKNVVASSSTYSKDSNNCFDYASDSDLSEEEIQEREELVRALERSAWVQAKAARMLDMTVRQINYRIKKLNIVVKKL
ncbi:MAG: hypothetical protein C0603_09130 [Denitrovibrio sp.]|nr:MAG: hypothetical protein C0603_09130 [Denitrovibrio sp.]